MLVGGVATQIWQVTAVMKRTDVRDKPARSPALPEKALVTFACPVATRAIILEHLTTLALAEDVLHAEGCVIVHRPRSVFVHFRNLAIRAVEVSNAQSAGHPELLTIAHVWQLVGGCKSAKISNSLAVMNPSTLGIANGGVTG